MRSSVREWNSDKGSSCELGKQLGIVRLGTSGQKDRLARTITKGGGGRECWLAQKIWRQAWTPLNVRSALHGGNGTMAQDLSIGDGRMSIRNASGTV